MKALAFSILLLLTSSCSWITSKRSLFGEEEEASAQAQNPNAVVPKAQYDQLLNRYNSLLDQTKDLPAQGEQVGGDQALMGQLSQVKETPKNPELAETVDVFAKLGDSTSVDTTSTVPSMVSNGSAVAPDYQNVNVEGEIETLRKAEALVYSNRNDEALKLIKTIENSKVRQVAVRARFLLGELMFNQGEFDLSMQVYERILSHDAFSGVVIKTLGRLIVCSEKLGLTAKKDKYYSMLHDFFGA